LAGRDGKDRCARPQTPSLRRIERRCDESFFAHKSFLLKEKYVASGARNLSATVRFSAGTVATNPALPSG
jgi:hypothetical protein